MKLELPYPPSANRYWRVWQGRARKSHEAREYQNTVKLSALGQRAKQGIFAPLHGPVRVVVSVYRPRRQGDLDNALKVFLDALKGIAFVDDAQVVDLQALRLDDRKRPRIEVLVETCEAPK